MIYLVTIIEGYSSKIALNHERSRARNQVQVASPLGGRCLGTARALSPQEFRGRVVVRVRSIVISLAATTHFPPYQTSAAS